MNITARELKFKIFLLAPSSYMLFVSPLNRSCYSRSPQAKYKPKLQRKIYSELKLTRRSFIFFLSFFALFLGSCSSNKKSLREHKGSYLESAKLNFDAGEQALKQGDFEKAIKYFQFVRSKYPFSQYAALSDLRIDDTRFEQKKWLDASSAYEVFIRLHPRHAEAAFASYREGLSYFYAIPEDFFLFPSSSSRDQTYTKEALEVFNRFIASYPTSEYIKDALVKRNILLSKLAKHTMVIASYYLKRQRYQAAVNRLLSVEELYPEAPESTEALFLAANILWQDLKDYKQAQAIYLRIINDEKDSPFAEQASSQLEKLQKEEQNESVSDTP
jgi:outer membrane protein assembly factor BamD